MIKVILNGCNGRMGKAISELAKPMANLNIAAGIDKITSTQFSYPVYSNINDCDEEADIILDFSRPEALQDLSGYALRKNLPLVLCTTGYSEEQTDFINMLSEKLPIFHSANMSLGINLLNNLLKKISSFLYDDFDIEIIEKHHNQKVDSPSGTAILLADTIKKSIQEDTSFIFGRHGNKKRERSEIGIHSVRGGGIVGDHEVIFAGHGEIITLQHSALSREVFASGALRACMFMYNKDKGLYSMDNLISEII